MANRTVVDLTHEPASALRGALLRAAEILPPGGLELHLSEPPELLLAAVNNHLRGTLRWSSEAVEGGYRVLLQRMDEVSPADVVDVLLRHHQTLDTLLQQALQAAAAKQPAETFDAFAIQLRRHIHVENEILVPRFTSSDRAVGDAASTMLREHEEILSQLALTEECAGEGAESADQLDVFLALLSATLAKHEHREEAMLFPHWQRGLEQASPAAREAVFQQVCAVLES